MIQVVLHEMWVPPNASGYGEKCRFRGVMAFWIGSVLFEVRYYVHPECVQFMPALLSRDTGRSGILGEIGLNLPANAPFSKQEAEAFVNEKIAPVLLMSVDGR